MLPASFQLHANADRAQGKWRPHLPILFISNRWEDRPLPGHTWTKFLEAKRKELQRLNGAYKNTLKNASEWWECSNCAHLRGRAALV